MLSSRNSREAALEELFSLWSPLSASQCELLSASAEWCHFKKGELIYREHDESDSIMVLLSGKVKVYMEGVGGRHQIIRVIKSTEWFGYRAYFAGEPHRTSAMAFESSSVVKVPMAVMSGVLSECPHLCLRMIEHLSLLLGQSDGRTVTLTQKHIRGRLAEALLFLMDRYGLEEDGCTLSIYLSREDLASLSNMTTSNAIRTLSAFASEHLLAIDGRKIKVIDRDELLRVSKMG